MIFVETGHRLNVTKVTYRWDGGGVCNAGCKGAVVVKEVNLVSAEYIVKRLGLQGAWQEERSRVGYAFLGTRNLPP